MDKKKVVRELKKSLAHRTIKEVASEIGVSASAVNYWKSDKCTRVNNGEAVLRRLKALNKGDVNVPLNFEDAPKRKVVPNSNVLTLTVRTSSGRTLNLDNVPSSNLSKILEAAEVL